MYIVMMGLFSPFSENVFMTFILLGGGDIKTIDMSVSGGYGTRITLIER